MEAVETFHIRGRVFQVVGGLPSGGVPPEPFDQVLGPSVVGAGIPNFFNFPFFLTFDFHGRRGGMVRPGMGSWLAGSRRNT